ncbi:MAG TPA: hypothetical protein VF146_04160 [Bryobacteraceae bacterium]
MATVEERLKVLDQEAEVYRLRMTLTEQEHKLSNLRLDKTTSLLDRLVETNNHNAESIAALALKIDQLVDALLHPAGNGKSNRPRGEQR